MESSKTSNYVTTRHREELRKILQDPVAGDLENRIIAWVNSIHQDVSNSPPGQENKNPTSKHQRIGDGPGNIFSNKPHQKF